jgi:hypothetical protein
VLVVLLLDVAVVVLVAELVVVVVELTLVDEDVLDVVIVVTVLVVVDEVDVEEDVTDDDVDVVLVNVTVLVVVELIVVLVSVTVSVVLVSVTVSVVVEIVVSEVVSVTVKVVVTVVIVVVDAVVVVVPNVVVVLVVVKTLLRHTSLKVTSPTVPVPRYRNDAPADVTTPSMMTRSFTEPGGTSTVKKVSPPRPSNPNMRDSVSAELTTICSFHISPSRHSLASGKSIASFQSSPPATTVCAEKDVPKGSGNLLPAHDGSGGPMTTFSAGGDASAALSGASSPCGATCVGNSPGLPRTMAHTKKRG